MDYLLKAVLNGKDPALGKMVKICPECDNITCFLLPYFDHEKGEIIEGLKICPRCIGERLKKLKPLT
jgi:hypothetical protein